MFTDPCTIALQTDNQLMAIHETKFILSGQFERPNGHIMRDQLAYISATKEEAIATCQRNNPHFHIHTVRVDESVPEVVKVQALC